MFLASLAALLAPATALAEDDEWSKAIQTGIKQEGGLTRDELQKERERDAQRARWRQVAYGGLGYEVADKYEFGENSLHDPAGPGLTVGYGLRGLGPRLSLQARAMLSLSRWSSDNDNGAYHGCFGCYSSFSPVGTVLGRSYYDSGGSLLAVEPWLEIGGRLRPLSSSSPWYLGLGARLGYMRAFGSRTQTGTETYVSAPSATSTRPFSQDESFSGGAVQLGGIFETGALFGEDETWDIGIRGFFGGSLDNGYRIDAHLVVGWALP